jgi:hypothetical protein
MIHYILLPAEERHALRREYRLRLVIILLFFVSLAALIGIAALVPSFLYSYTQEKSAIEGQQVIQKLRKESGADQIENDLVLSQAIAKRILTEKDPVVYNQVVQNILSHRSKGLSITSFALLKDNGTTTAAKISLSGKAATRDSLLQFKNDLLNDKLFTEVDLPLEDLAKSKDVSFNMNFKLKK